MSPVGWWRPRESGTGEPNHLARLRSNDCATVRPCRAGKDLHRPGARPRPAAPAEGPASEWFRSSGGDLGVLGHGERPAALAIFAHETKGPPEPEDRAVASEPRADGPARWRYLGRGQLNQQFTRRCLLAPHHIGGAHGFVGGNQDEAFENRRPWRASRTERVPGRFVAQPRTDVCPHQRHRVL